MLLRSLMVVVVASLGVDAPSGCDLGQLARQGQAWCRAQMERLEGVWDRLPAPRAIADSPRSLPAGPATAPAPAAMPNGMLAFADTPATPTAAPADASFAAVVDAMVADFAGPAPEVAVRDAQDDADLTAALDRESTEHAVAEVLEMIEDQPEVAEAPLVSRAERVAAAVQLTGQAFHAWMSLVQVTPSAR